jgi:hypothetical protein
MVNPMNLITLCLGLLLTGARTDTHPVPDARVLASGLQDATSLYLTPDGDLYVVESGANRILRLDRNGTRVDSLGRLGFGDYRFDRPLDVDATNGMKIYVSDYNNRRIQIYDRRLQFLSTVDLRDAAGSGRQHRPTRLVVSPFDELFVLDDEETALLKFNRNGRFEFSVDLRRAGITGLPVAMAWAGDVLFLADQVTGVIHMVSGSGTYLRFIGRMEGVSALSGKSGRVWVAAGERIAELDELGRIIREFQSPGVAGAVSLAAGRERVYILHPDRILVMGLPQPE